MHLIFLICAVVGGAILVIQVLLLLVGGGGGHDVDVGVGGVGAEMDVDFGSAGGHHGGIGGHDLAGGAHDVHGGTAHAHHGGSDAGAHPAASFTVISFKTLVAFLTFFGLAGLEAGHLRWSTGWQLLAAIAAGTLALYGVAYLWYVVTRLGARGNINIRNALGRTATVYLSIPPRDGGSGKVTVTLQGRTMEWKAVSRGNAIPTGAAVRVLDVVDSDTLRVELEEAPRPA